MKDSSFDIVYTNSLHHVHPDVEPAIEEIYRILKPEGLFCCMEPISFSFFNQIRKLWYMVDWKYFQDNERALDIDKLLDLTKKFEVLKIKYGGNIGYLFWSLFIALRIPNSFVNIVKNPLVNIEKLLDVNIKCLSWWVLFLARKK